MFSHPSRRLLLIWRPGADSELHIYVALYSWWSLVRHKNSAAGGPLLAPSWPLDGRLDVRGSSGMPFPSRPRWGPGEREKLTCCWRLQPSSPVSGCPPFQPAHSTEGRRKSSGQAGARPTITHFLFLSSIINLFYLHRYIGILCDLYVCTYVRSV